MNFLSKYPSAEALLKKHKSNNAVVNVNGHVHTPYSFSSFSDISEIFDLAEKEEVKVLGINDFFVADGYGKFSRFASETKKFPLFNVEFIGLMQDLQASGTTINDPSNPGRIYFSGKGLNYPYCVSLVNQGFLAELIRESQLQVSEMITKADALVKAIDTSLSLSYNDIKSKYARELVRERHIATAIRVLADEKYADLTARAAFYTQLFGNAPKSDISNIPAIENEIRGQLLKAGGAAFVPESPASFPAVTRIIEYILDAGGIPCYPVLLDDRKGNLITGFEKDWETMDKTLKSLNVHMIELIPSRNSIEKMREFVAFFTARGYVISLGSEHNTPGIFPIEVKIDGDKVMPDDLKEVSYQGACVIAAHQYLKTNGLEGFVTTDGDRTSMPTSYFIELGNAVIKEFIK